MVLATSVAAKSQARADLLHLVEEFETGALADLFILQLHKRDFRLLRNDAFEQPRLSGQYQRWRGVGDRVIVKAATMVRSQWAALHRRADDIRAGIPQPGDPPPPTTPATPPPGVAAAAGPTAANSLVHFAQRSKRGRHAPAEKVDLVERAADDSAGAVAAEESAPKRRGRPPGSGRNPTAETAARRGHNAGGDSSGGDEPPKRRGGRKPKAAVAGGAAPSPFVTTLAVLRARRAEIWSDLSACDATIAMLERDPRALADHVIQDRFALK